jgi:hypothetical protein
MVNFNHFVLDQVKVGDAAQNTAVLVLNMKYLKELSLLMQYRLAQKLYTSIDPTNFSTEVNNGSLVAIMD